MRPPIRRLTVIVVVNLTVFALLFQAGQAVPRIIPGATSYGHFGTYGPYRICRDGAMFGVLMTGETIPPDLQPDVVIAGDLDFWYTTSPPPLFPNPEVVPDEPAPETVIAHLSRFAIPKNPIDTADPPDGVADVVYSGNAWVRWSTPMDVGAQVFERIGDLEPGYVIRMIDTVYTVADCNVFAQIDIKPGDASNIVNLGSNGGIEVAILSTPRFDATQVDPMSVCFGPQFDVVRTPLLGDCSAKHGRGHLKDIDRDGDVDLLLRFESSQTDLSKDTTNACIDGTTFSGTPIAGCDVVTVKQGRR
jgi:hypothetical protein